MQHPEACKFAARTAETSEKPAPALRPFGGALSWFGAAELCNAEEVECVDVTRNRKLAYERLLRLADKLQGVGPYSLAGPIPDDRFDLTTWARWRDLVKEDGKTPISRETFLADLTTQQTQCGTTACACGWAATDPWFNAVGLRLDEQVTEGVFYYEFGFEGPDDSGWETIRSVFQINEFRTNVLFDCDSYIADANADGVANRIRHFLASSYFDGVRPE